MRSLRPILPVVFLLLSACEALQPAAVRTDREGARPLPVPESGDVFQFAVYGDRTGGPASGIEVLRQAVGETNLIDPDLVMTVGDLVQGYNETPQWLEQMREYKSVMDGLAMPWYPVAGNHDIYWRGSPPPPGHHEVSYEAHFGPLWYWFAHKNAAFIVLYSDEGDPETNRKGLNAPDLIRMSEAQLSWLERTLTRTSAYDHVFLFLHHPRWITERYPGGNWESVHALLMAAGNVSAVFAGHIHRQRYDGPRDGIHYFTLATLGGRIPMEAPGTGWLHHMLLVSVRTESFEVATLPVGAVWDPKAMTAEHLADLDRARKTPIEHLSGHLHLGQEGDAAGELRYALRNEASRPLEITVALDANAGDWLLRPNHRHLTLAPNEAREIGFDLRRHADGFREAFSLPTIAFQVDYIGEDRRVSFPARQEFAPLRPLPESLPRETGTPDRAIELDGSGAGLWFDSDAVDLASAPFTLEAEVRVNRMGETGVIIGKLHSGGFALGLKNGQPRFYVGLERNRMVLKAPQSESLQAGRWYHIAGVFDGSEARLYMDGRLIARREVPPGQAYKPNDLPLYVGGNPDKNGRMGTLFEGAIDEVRVSTTARYQGEAHEPRTRFQADDVTALLLHLDGDGGAFARDASAYNRHGIGIGSIRFIVR